MSGYVDLDYNNGVFSPPAPVTPPRTPAPRAATVDTEAAVRRAEELDHVDCRWTHTAAAYEWDVGAVIRALAVDLDATRADLDAARDALPDAGLLERIAEGDTGWQSAAVRARLGAAAARIRALTPVPVPAADVPNGGAS